MRETVRYWRFSEVAAALGMSELRALSGHHAVG